ncbi:hypothetical protein ACQY0O_006679 [Thecaphora frezii]
MEQIKFERGQHVWWLSPEGRVRSAFFIEVSETSSLLVAGGERNGGGCGSWLSHKVGILAFLPLQYLKDGFCRVEHKEWGVLILEAEKLNPQ